MKRIPFRKLALLGLLGLALTATLWVLFRPDPAFTPMHPSVALLPAETPMPDVPASWFAQHIPMSWSWLWRLRDRIRGPLASVLMDARILDCTNFPEETLAGLLAKPARAENGMRGWLVDCPTLAGLLIQLREKEGRDLMHPSVQTSHGVQASMSLSSAVPVSGVPVQAGLSLSVLPLVQPDGLELFANIRITEAMTNRASRFSGAPASTEPPGSSPVSLITNLEAATHWRLPDGMSFFLLAPASTNEARRLGVIVSATVSRPTR